MKIILSLIIGLLVVVSVTACQSEDTATTETTQQQEVEEKIIEILNKTPVNENFQPTIGQMIATVFYNYELDYYLYNAEYNQYMVTISGDYNPSTEIDNLSMNGSVRFLLDLDSDYCAVNHDPNDIMGTFLVHILN